MGSLSTYLSNPDNSGHTQDAVQQPDNTAEPAKTGSTPEVKERPPIYKEPQRLNNFAFGPDQPRLATPLAATLLARFDPNDPREQPAEHAVFIDSRLRKRGYI